MLAKVLENMVSWIQSSTDGVMVIGVYCIMEGFFPNYSTGYKMLQKGVLAITHSGVEDIGNYHHFG